ncbi:MAG: 6-phosphogluconolactonase [Coprobacillaceae bacterium]
MKIIVTKDYEGLSNIASSIILSTMCKDKRVNISLTGGNSPKRTYEILKERIYGIEDNFTNVHYYNFDEIELPKSGTKFTLDAITKDIYEPLKVQKDNVHILDNNTMNEIRMDLDEHNGLDLMLIGLGNDGHFCGNMPNTTIPDADFYLNNNDDSSPWYDTYKVVFPDPNDMPTHFVTMGPATVMKVKHLVLIVNGEKKAKAVKRMLTDDVSVKFPSTLLRSHPNLTIIIDQKAAMYL